MNPRRFDQSESGTPVANVSAFSFQPADNQDICWEGGGGGGGGGGGLANLPKPQVVVITGAGPLHFRCE